jgi:hypothetical protein
LKDVIYQHIDIDAVSQFEQFVFGKSLHYVTRLVVVSGSTVRQAVSVQYSVNGTQ